MACACRAATPSVPTPLAVTIWIWVWCSAWKFCAARCQRFMARTAWAAWSTSLPCSPMICSRMAKPLAAVSRPAMTVRTMASAWAPPSQAVPAPSGAGWCQRASVDPVHWKTWAATMWRVLCAPRPTPKQTKAIRCWGAWSTHHRRCKSMCSRWRTWTSAPTTI